MTQPRVIFVFGSNLAGRHAGGAARDAVNFWGAVMGVPVGAAGESYAIPTCDFAGGTLPIARIVPYVSDFAFYAAAHPDQVFYVTPIGCGIAGHSPLDIAPLFAGAGPNVQLPAGWRELIAATPDATAVPAGGAQ